MDEYQNNNLQLEQEDSGLDIMALLRTLWYGRKAIIITTCVGIVLGFAAALSMKRVYTVESVLVPQVNSKSNSSLGSLAALAGFDISSASSTQDLSPLVYPHIVQSVPYRLELLNTPLHYEKVDTAVSIKTYLKEYAKPSVFDVIKKYTIGLPFVILDAILPEKPDLVPPANNEVVDNTPKPLYISRKDAKMLRKIGESVTLMVEKKEGYLTLTVKGSEPVQTAELGMKAQQLLQDEISRFRTEKAQNELEYIQGRYDEIKKECEMYQEQLATASDKNKNTTSARSQLEKERIQAKYNTSYSIYMEMAKQLEQAKMKVKKDTPVFTVLKPITVPVKASNSRAKTLIAWVFLAFCIGCCIPLCKEYMPKLKEKLAASDKKEEDKTEA